MYKIDLFGIKILQDCPSKNLDSFILDMDLDMDIIWISKMNKIESISTFDNWFI